MHPDPQSAPEPVVHVVQRPMFVTQGDGSVRAYYPGEDWFVTGTDRGDAKDRLVAESQRQMQDDADAAQHWEMTQRHLDGEQPPGFEVRKITTTEYEQRQDALGERLRRGMTE